MEVGVLECLKERLERHIDWLRNRTLADESVRQGALAALQGVMQDILDLESQELNRMEEWYKK